MDNDNDDISVDISGEIELDQADIKSFEQLVKSILRQFDVGRAQVSVAIVDDEGIVKVHEKFLNSSSTTDVISFDLSDDDDEFRTFEVVVNCDQAVRQSQLRGHSAVAEMGLYITHGMLHNMGYDDHDEDDAREMHSKEDEILQQAGFGIIYGRKELDN